MNLPRVMLKADNTHKQYADPSSYMKIELHSNRCVVARAHESVSKYGRSFLSSRFNMAHDCHTSAHGVPEIKTYSINILSVCVGRYDGASVGLKQPPMTSVVTEMWVIYSVNRE